MRPAINPTPAGRPAFGPKLEQCRGTSQCSVTPIVLEQSGMILRLQKLTKQYAIDLDAACEPKKRWFGTSPTEDPANAKLFPGTWVGFREHIKEVHRPPAHSNRFRAHPSPRTVSCARLILACTPPRPDWRPVCAMAHSAARPVVPRKPRRPSPALRAGRRGPEATIRWAGRPSLGRSLPRCSSCASLSRQRSCSP